MSNSISNVVKKYTREAQGEVTYNYAMYDEATGDLTSSGSVKGPGGLSEEFVHDLVNFDVTSQDDVSTLLDTLKEDDTDDEWREVVEDEGLPDMTDYKGDVRSVLIAKGDWGRGGATLTLISTSKSPSQLKKMIEDVWGPLEKKMRQWDEGEDNLFEEWMDEGNYVDVIYDGL